MKSPIRLRLILLFVAQIIIVLGVTGLYLNWYFRNLLETELGNTLELAAASIASQLDVELLLTLRPGDELSRTYQNFRNRLLDSRDATGVQRVYVADRNIQSLVDTEANVGIGKKHLRLEADYNELSRVWEGSAASSVLFKGSDGRLYKSGYAPLYVHDQVAAVIGVEGSAHTLEAVARIGGFLLRLGSAGVVLAIFLAVLFSSQLTRPLNRLREAAVTIGHGDYKTPVQVRGHDEIAFLARTMEDMRKGVITRDTQLKAMLAGVAHEIRNPLGGIELYAGLLLDELKTPDQRERANKILREVQNLKSIVNDFLNYARPASPKREKCMMAELLSNIKTLMKGELAEQRVRFSYSTDNSAVLIDQKHAQQILINLMKNSLQAMHRGGAVKVDSKMRGAHVDVFFSDTGSGIPPQAVSQLFEPFFTTRTSGTGLGLAICRTLCEANRGSIELHETGSKGTTFRLRFELAGEEKSS